LSLSELRIGPEALDFPPKPEDILLPKSEDLLSEMPSNFCVIANSLLAGVAYESYYLLSEFCFDIKVPPSSYP